MGNLSYADHYADTRIYAIQNTLWRDTLPEKANEVTQHLRRGGLGTFYEFPDFYPPHHAGLEQHTKA